jgi:hypothetical protein
MGEEKMAAVQRALEYDVPVRTLAELIDVSKDIVARHKKHMYDPPPIRRRRARSSAEYMRRIMVETGMNPMMAASLSARDIRRALGG